MGSIAGWIGTWVGRRFVTVELVCRGVGIRCVMCAVNMLWLNCIDSRSIISLIVRNVSLSIIIKAS